MDGRRDGPRGARVEYLRSVVQGVLARRPELVAAQPHWPWARLLPATSGGDARTEWSRLRDAAVLANLAALAAAPRRSDYTVLAALVAQLGGPVVARIQHERSAELEPDPDFPIGTAFTRALSPTHYRPVFAADPATDPTDTTDTTGTGESALDEPELGELCAAVSMRFLVQGVDDQPPATPIGSVEEFLHCFASASLPEWRRHLVHYAVEPWAPYARQLADLAEEAGHEGYRDGMRLFLAALRDETILGERQTIAAEVRRLVDESGLSRRDFARRVGTSASRLSSYAMGGTTPSAAMFVRIRRAARHLRTEEQLAAEPAPAAPAAPAAATPGLAADSG